MISKMFKILGTGSGGNCFLFGDLMIDVGLPYSKIRDDVKKHVLLTHIHGDHFNKSTIRKLAVAHDVIFYAHADLCTVLESIGITSYVCVEVGKAYSIGDYKISPVLAYHDVTNIGYRILINGHKHFHITDTATLEGITAKDYDSGSIECNHCEIAAAKIIEESQENGEFTHLIGAMNSHLSVQQTIDFVKANNIKKLYPIHVGASTINQVRSLLDEQITNDRLVRFF